MSWVGRSTCTVRPLLPDDQAGFPIRILKDAIMDGVPFKDMLITAEHCLFLGGCFVPARMLVNGRSIFYDRSFSSYDYYHVETETHAVIIADGVLTESYLDTGNRGSFRQAGTVLSLPRCRNLTWDDAAAPLNVARTFVEPLFRILSRRAENRGVAVRTAAPVLTHEADIHLRTSTGLVLRPIRAKASPVAFMIPDGVETVYIVSNASRPCDVTGPFVDDRRRCGILVGNTTLFDSDTTRPITAHLRQADLPGWHGVEDGSVRWTSGNARLDLGAREPGHIGLLALQVLSSGPYVLETTTDEKIALQA